MENWRRLQRCPRTKWMKTIQQDLKSNNLSMSEATDVTQNCPLWRLMSTFVLCTPSGACHKRRTKWRRRQISVSLTCQWMNYRRETSLASEMNRVQQPYHCTMLSDQRSCHSTRLLSSPSASSPVAVVSQAERLSLCRSTSPSSHSSSASTLSPSVLVQAPEHLWWHCTLRLPTA